MAEKNIRFQEWLERFNLLVDQSIAELRGIKVKARRVREKKAVKWYSFPTQAICRDIVRGLGELYDIAFAKDKSLDLKEREKWSRIAAFIAQTINTIIDSYDEIKIEKILDELNTERYELTETGKINFSHPDGTHDDRLWPHALAAYAAQQAPPPGHPHTARTI